MLREKREGPRHPVTEDFGDHPAKSNFEGCISYALAKSKGEPLLFKGQAFSRTDVKSARA
jgi:uncharacterized protein with PIN domain